MQFFSNETYVDDGIKSFEDEDAGLLVYFGEDVTEPVIIKCGISYVDLEGARKNLEAESKDFDFDKMRENAFYEWEKVFDGVEVTGTDEIDLKLFYIVFTTCF